MTPLGLYSRGDPKLARVLPLCPLKPWPSRRIVRAEPEEPLERLFRGRRGNHIEARPNKEVVQLDGDFRALPPTLAIDLDKPARGLNAIALNLAHYGGAQSLGGRPGGAYSLPSPLRRRPAMALRDPTVDLSERRLSQRELVNELEGEGRLLVSANAAPR